MANFVIWDTETRSLANLKQVGAYEYAADPSTIGYFISLKFDDWDRARGIWLFDPNKNFEEPLHTPDLDRLFEHVAAGKPCLAWNAAFDREIWNYAVTETHDAPVMAIEQTYCIQAAAEACNLPGGLDEAARACFGHGAKDPKGKAQMLLFADASQPVDERHDFLRLERYAIRDTDEASGLLEACRDLTEQEWAEYHQSERINARGIGVDRKLCRMAARFHEAEKEHVNDQLTDITQGVITKATQSQRLSKWAFEHLPPSIGALLVTERDEDGNAVRLSLSKGVIPVLREEADLQDVPLSDRVLDFLDVVEYGRSSSALKFQKLFDGTASDGRLRGQYAFNGAGQTGRFSSRGVQIHNLTRDRLDDEEELIDEIRGGCPVETIRDASPVGSVSYVLSRLIRPAFIAEPGKVFVWGDWASIEAMVLPWLSGDDDTAEDILEVFRDGQDLYTIQAQRMGLGGRNARQAAKVAQLSLGFGGAVGAYRRMARNYGLRVSDEEALPIVQAWRKANPWALTFWEACTRASQNAIKAWPDTFTAGRLRYFFAPGLLDGSLVCLLPDDRPLVYPAARWESWKDDEDVERHAYRFRAKSGRRRFWHGLLAENGTQATAASILRSTMTRSAVVSDVTVAHTHDEVILEVPEEDERVWCDLLKATMEVVPEWAEGLPLRADIVADTFYHK